MVSSIYTLWAAGGLSAACLRPLYEPILKAVKVHKGESLLQPGLTKAECCKGPVDTAHREANIEHGVLAQLTERPG